MCLCVSMCMCTHLFPREIPQQTCLQAEKHLCVNIPAIFIRQGLSEHPLHAKHDCWRRIANQTDPFLATKEV